MHLVAEARECLDADLGILGAQAAEESLWTRDTGEGGEDQGTVGDALGTGWLDGGVRNAVQGLDEKLRRIVDGFGHDSG